MCLSQGRNIRTQALVNILAGGSLLEELFFVWSYFFCSELLLLLFIVKFHHNLSLVSLRSWLYISKNITTCNNPRYQVSPAKYRTMSLSAIIIIPRTRLRGMSVPEEDHSFKRVYPRTRRPGNINYRLQQSLRDTFAEVCQIYGCVYKIVGCLFHGCHDCQTLALPNYPSSGEHHRRTLRVSIYSIYTVE